MIQTLARQFAKFAGCSFVLAALALPSFAQNQNSNQSSGKSPSKRTSINFEDQLIEGQVQKPELFYLLQQRNNNFKRLIRLRENFLPEMRKTSEDLGRSSSAGGKGPAN